MKAVTYVLGVLLIVVFVAIVLAVFLMASAAYAQNAIGTEPKVRWQLGVCVDDPEVGRRCRLVGAPLPDEQLCRALRDSLRSKINNGRVHCARVLVDAEYDA